MNYIIYNPNSKGGNYKYAQYTSEALCKQGAKLTLVLPKNTQPYILNPDSYTLYPILLSDQPKTINTLLKKGHFLLRTIINPIHFFILLRKLESSNVIFNDFDQATAVFWAPLFRLLKKKHRFAVVLHDPDRDAYPGGLTHTHRSMKALLGIMDIAFFHECLPTKAYYSGFKGHKISIPHGIYLPAPADTHLRNAIERFKGDKTLLCIPGNIRLEKNYQLIIEALPMLGDCRLLIAGAAASSAIDSQALQSLAEKIDVAERIYWHTHYMSDEQFTSILEVADLVLLYYKSSFTSQSGILNQIAPLKKNVLISDTPSALSQLAKEFGLGTVTMADDLQAFVKGVQTSLKDASYPLKWDNYLNYASWTRQSELIRQTFESVRKIN